MDATCTPFHYFRVKARSCVFPLPVFRYTFFLAVTYACSLIFCWAETALIDIFFFSFERASTLSRWMAIGSNRSFTQREPTAIRFESIVRGRSWRISEKRERGLKKVPRNWKRSISINPHSSVFSNLLLHYMYTHLADMMVSYWIVIYYKCVCSKLN